MAQTSWTYTNKPLPTPPGPKKPPIWATYIEGRLGGFKIHANLGHCKNALSTAKHGIVYRWMPPNGVDTPGDPEWTPVLICNSDDWLDGGTNALNEFIENKKGLTEPAIVYKIHEEP